MSKENEGPDFEFLYARETGHMSTAEGDYVNIETHHNLSDGESRELIADAWGVSPDQVIEADRDARRAGRAVAFTRWNSSWDPRAEKSELN